VSIDSSFQILMDNVFTLRHGENIKRRIFMKLLRRDCNVLSWDTFKLVAEFR
jgi:hypothetical protein